MLFNKVKKCPRLTLGSSAVDSFVVCSVDDTHTIFVDGIYYAFCNVAKKTLHFHLTGGKEMEDRYEGGEMEGI